MRVLVCGSRTFSDRLPIHAVLSGLFEREHVVLIEGGAHGADAIAACIAEEFFMAHAQYPADWDRYGKRAGYVRNAQMLEDGKPDVVWAFVDKPLAESKGTAMMVDLARKTGVPTYVVSSG